jgi:hypothetical protein
VVRDPSGEAATDAKVRLQSAGFDEVAVLEAA